MLQRISIHRASNSLTHRCPNRKDAFCNEGTPHAHAIRNSIQKEEDEGWWVSECKWKRNRSSERERESRMRAREKRKRELRRQLKYLVKRAMNRITVRTVLTKYRQCYVCLCLHVSGRKEKNFPVFPISRWDFFPKWLHVWLCYTSYRCARNWKIISSILFY